MEVPTTALQALFAHGDATLFVWRDEPGWPVAHASPNVTRLLGIEPEALTSGRVAFADLVHPDDLGALASAVRASVASGATTCAHDDYRLRRADGRWIWVHDVTVIERDAAGSVRSFVGYVVDVTRHHERRAELVEQRDRLQLVLEGTRLGLWDWNPQTDEVVFDAGWARMLGHELDELEPSLQAWSSRVHPDDLDACHADIQRHIDGETDFYENVHRMRHKDGRWIYILDRGRVCERDADGRPTRFTGTHTDITQQKLSELAAQRASRATGVFLAVMSHEIGTPLNWVLGVLQLFETTALDEQQRRYVDVVRESGETLLTIISDVLDTSKIEAGEMRIEHREFAVRRMLESVHELYAERAMTKGLRYELEIERSVPAQVEGDERRIRQIVSNLLSNAFKFTERGAVVLSARAESGGGPVDRGAVDRGAVELVLTVRDTGPGIAGPERLWDAFRQADESVARRYGGTGLGLTICRQLAELMGGSIAVDTELGVGTAFVARLPVVSVAGAAAVDEEPAHDLPVLPALDVLVAEDNRVNQLVVRAMLAHLGHRVHVVEHGAAAVAHCARDAYDVVLMDLHMPEMGGVEACERIRAAAAAAVRRPPRIVAVSADVFAADTEGFRTAGFDGSLTKPFRIAELAAVLGTAPAGAPVLTAD